MLASSYELCARYKMRLVPVVGHLQMYMYKLPNKASPPHVTDCGHQPLGTSATTCTHTRVTHKYLHGAIEMYIQAGLQFVLAVSIRHADWEPMHP